MGLCNNWVNLIMGLFNNWVNRISGIGKNQVKISCHHSREQLKQRHVMDSDTATLIYESSRNDHELLGVRVNREHNFLFARALPLHSPLHFARTIYVRTSNTQYKHMLLLANVTSGG